MPATGASAVHDAIGTFVVLFVPQVVVSQPLPALAADPVQLDTPVGPVTIGAGQVVVVQPLPAAAVVAAPAAAEPGGYVPTPEELIPGETRAVEAAPAVEPAPATN